MGKEMAPHLRAEDKSLGVLDSELPEGPPTLLYGRDLWSGLQGATPAAPAGEVGSPTHLPRGSAAARARAGWPSERRENGQQGDRSAGALPGARPTDFPRAAPAWERPASEGRGSAQPQSQGTPSPQPGEREC